MAKFTTIDVGEKLDYTLGWDDEDWLGTDTISSSSWSILAGTGLTLTGQTNTPTTATVFAEALTAGTWRLRNSITTAGGRKGVEDIVVTARAGATALGYLSPEDAEARLYSRYGIESSLSVGDIAAGSQKVDMSGPFIGSKLVTDGTQLLEFPRSINPDGTANTNTAIPDSVLDYAALCSYGQSVDETPGVKSEGAGSVSATYEEPRYSQTVTRKGELLAPYQLKFGMFL